MSTTQTVQQNRPGAAASGERNTSTSTTSTSSSSHAKGNSNVSNTVTGSAAGNSSSGDSSVNNNSNNISSNNSSSNSNINTNSPAVPDKSEVGWLFVQQYYTFLNEQPNKLHLFYTKQSTLCHGVEGESVPSYYGQTQITQRIKERQFNDCKVLISNMDCQESANGGVVVQVLGEMGNNGQRSQKFVQTFFLAQQPRGYYVLNDIFRFLKEDISDDSEPLTSTPSVESSVAPTATVGVEDQTPSVAATSAEPAQQIAAAVKEQPKEPQVSSAPVKPAQQQQQRTSEANSAAKPADSKKVSDADKVTEPAKPVAATKPNAEATASQTSSTANGPSKSTASLSWASLAAKKKESEANGHAAPAKAIASQQPAVKPAAAPATAASTTAASSTPATNNIIVTTKPGHVPGRKPQDFHSAYIRNVSKVDDNLLRKGLEKIGQLTHFQVEKTKNCAFVDFIDAATLKAALAVQELRVGDQVVLIEERKRGGAKNKNNYTNSKKGGFTNVNKNGKKAL